MVAYFKALICLPLKSFGLTENKPFNHRALKWVKKLISKEIVLPLSIHPFKTPKSAENQN